MAKQTKKQQTLAALDSEKLYTVDEAIATLREHKAKFDETVEVAMNLMDAGVSDILSTSVKGTIVLTITEAGEMSFRSEK